MNYILKNP